MDEKIITTNELEVLANEFYGSKITQEEYFSRLDDRLLSGTLFESTCVFG